MIYGYLHQGSGAGNQLFRYLAIRGKAKDLGVDFRMVYNPDGSGKVASFKCQSFIDFPQDKIITKIPQGLKVFNEKKIVENGVDIRGYDPEFNFIEDNTVIDGEFQDERYWKEHDIDKWLKVEPLLIENNVCLICFRGGEYTVFPDLFLTQQYWDKAIELMKNEKPDIKFLVVTDDLATAKKFFPNFEFMDEIKGKHDMGVDWRATRYAKYLILSNASFYILPALLNEDAKIIAPRYWARHNTKVWALPQNYYRKFNYI